MYDVTIEGGIIRVHSDACRAAVRFARRPDDATDSVFCRPAYHTVVRTATPQQFLGRLLRLVGRPIKIWDRDNWPQPGDVVTLTPHRCDMRPAGDLTHVSIRAARLAADSEWNGW